MASEQIETLIAAQKEIINATWNIERRAARAPGGRRATSRPLPHAQSELKARAEQMCAAGGRGRGAMRFPQQVALPQSAASAAAGRRRIRWARRSRRWRGRSISSKGQQTSEALPHEMAALQGLLQAQAEVRRREVAQQAGTSMGGIGRQGQDLSALFDKELQRQQRTNYETRSQTETRADRPETESALDKIRDLAQRQEELAGSSASSRRDELGRGIEAPAREADARAGSASSAGRGARAADGAARRRSRSAATARSQASGGSGEIRDAAEQMRGAAGELQRQSPATAAATRRARGGRPAPARATDASRQSRGRQRAAGELRLEAQQIADEQRRIAGEAVAAGEGTSGDADRPDAWRRLSGEKDKLADRVDALEKSVQQMAAGQKPGAQLGPALAQPRRKSSRRVRSRVGCATLRRKCVKCDGRRPPAAGDQTVAARGAAEAEQQLARTLDQMVDRMRRG